MSKINPAKLTLEDFPKQRDWIGPLFTILNTFTGEIVRAFSNQITVEENLFQEIREIKFTSGSTDFPLKFRTKFNQAPKVLQTGYLFDSTEGTYATQSPWVVWGYADGSIVISDVSGLTTGHQYVLRVLVIYG